MAPRSRAADRCSWARSARVRERSSAASSARLREMWYNNGGLIGGERRFLMERAVRAERSFTSPNHRLLRMSGAYGRLTMTSRSRRFTVRLNLGVNFLYVGQLRSGHNLHRSVGHRKLPQRGRDPLQDGTPRRSWGGASIDQRCETTLRNPGSTLDVLHVARRSDRAGRKAWAFWRARCARQDALYLAPKLGECCGGNASTACPPQMSTRFSRAPGQGHHDRCELDLGSPTPPLDAVCSPDTAHPTTFGDDDVRKITRVFRPATSAQRRHPKSSASARARGATLPQLAIAWCWPADALRRADRADSGAKSRRHLEENVKAFICSQRRRPGRLDRLAPAGAAAGQRSSDDDMSRVNR